MTRTVTETTCPYCGHRELEVSDWHPHHVWLSCDRCEAVFPSGNNFTDACRIVEGISMTDGARKLVVS